MESSEHNKLTNTIGTDPSIENRLTAVRGGCLLGWVEKVKGLSKQRKKLTGGPDISLWVTRGKGVGRQRG